MRRLRSVVHLAATPGRAPLKTQRGAARLPAVGRLRHHRDLRPPFREKEVVAESAVGIERKLQIAYHKLDSLYGPGNCEAL